MQKQPAHDPFENQDETWHERLVGRLMMHVIDATEGAPLSVRRRRLGNWMRFVWGPLLGWPGAISDTLALVRPDMAPNTRRALARQTARHAGEALADLLTPKVFREILRYTPILGPGVETLKAAREDGRGTVIVTAGLGNPDAVFGTLAARGFDVATLDAPSSDDPLERCLIAARRALGGTRFADGDSGERALEAHVAKGGICVLSTDAFDKNGTPVRLFGARVRAPRLPAAIALRRHADFVPAFAVKRESGVYGLWLAKPIEHAHPEEMLQAYHDALEAAACQYPDQFSWAQPRWQPERYLSLAAPSTGP